MNEEQEVIIRCIHASIRKLRKEIDQLFSRKDYLEKVADQFYTAYLDELWTKCNIQLTEIYNTLFKKFETLFFCQTLMMRAKLGEHISENDIKSIETKS